MKAKVKTIDFFVSNPATSAIMEGKTENWFKRESAIFKVLSFGEIDEIINEFIADKNVVDIKINDFTMLSSNNGYGKLIRRTYTILYHE